MRVWYGLVDFYRQQLKSRWEPIQWYYYLILFIFDFGNKQQKLNISVFPQFSEDKRRTSVSRRPRPFANHVCCYQLILHTFPVFVRNTSDTAISWWYAAPLQWYAAYSRTRFLTSRNWLFLVYNHGPNPQTANARRRRWYRNSILCAVTLAGDNGSLHSNPDRTQTHRRLIMARCSDPRHNVFLVISTFSVQLELL